jgi:hypothetical protein
MFMLYLTTIKYDKVKMYGTKNILQEILSDALTNLLIFG